MLEIGFENTYFQVFQGFPALETVAHIQPNGQFWTVFGQNGQNGNFFQKSAWNIFSHLQALTNCKVSEKSNERFSSNSVTYGQTHVCTHERTRILRSPTTSSRDQKKFSPAYSRDKWPNLGQFWSKRAIFGIFEKSANLIFSTSVTMLQAKN